MTPGTDIEKIRRLPFFFILGRPRSGTTLLRTLLDVHPQVNIPLENSGMIHLYYKYRRVRTWDGKSCHELLKDFEKLNFIESWNLDWASIEMVFDQAADAQLSFPEVIKVFYFHYQSEFFKEGFTCLGDKSPLNSLYSRELSRAFPEASYIHLIRDYRANLASMSKHDLFSPSRTGILMQWKKSAEQIRELAGLHPEKYLQIRYEELVSDPVSTYEKVCDFLQLRFSAELLDPEYRKRAIRKIYDSPFLNQWHPNLSGRITRAHMHKWESELDAASVQLADYVAGNTGQHYSYKPGSRRFGIVFMFFTELKKLLFHLNEMNRYLYDRLPYRMKIRIRNRKFILTHYMIRLFRKHLGKH